MAEYETKIERVFSYHGTGYEVLLHNVPMMKIGKDWVLKINPSVIDRLVFEELPHQASRLTGNQIRFIRVFSGMTLKQFADRFGVSHAAVKKWENTRDDVTNMSWATEKDIRLFIVASGDAKPQEFRACYNELVTEASDAAAPVHLDIETMAIA